jgi:CubicO group peptidase (beta-lactamase class C family)
MKSVTVKSTLMLVLVLFMFGPAVKSQTVSQLLDGYCSYNRFWGSVILLQNDKVLFQKSYGYADKEQKKRNDAQTLFDLGSVTKTMTAVAILKLHDEGKLSVYDRVDKYIPGFINDKTDSITIINLLNHTSGMEANLGRKDERGIGIMPGSEPIGREQLIEKFRGTKLKSKPSTSYEYNNYGFTLLACIIEKVSGMEYAAYLKQAIFDPLKMADTRYKLDLVAQPAKGYTGVGTSDIKAASDPFHPSWIVGAGYVYSSTNDLSRYVSAVFTHKLFSESTLKLMMDSCVTAGKQNRQWALGWERKKIDGLDWYSHGGGVFGFSTKVGYLPEQGITVIILSNLVKELNFDEIYSAKFSFVDEITEKILKILNHKSVAYLPVPKGKASKKVTGTYQFDKAHHATVFLQNDSLFLTAEAKDNFTLFDYSLNRSQTDTTGNHSTCQLLVKSLMTANFEGFEKYCIAGLFNPKIAGQLSNVWKFYLSKGGSVSSYNIFSKSASNYTIAFHLEKAEIVMPVFFNDQNLIKGMFFQSVLPKCTVQTVHLVPAGKDEYVVDGYRNGGYSDFRVKYDSSAQQLSFATDVDSFTASKVR